MTPSLTSQGRWLFATGAVFLVAGVVLRQPVLVLFAQAPFVLLMVSAAMLLKAARVLDRRRAELSIRRRADRVESLVSTGETSLSVWLENQSGTPLRVVQLRPFVAGDLEVDIPEQHVAVAAGRATRFDVTVQPRGVGPASLQGFDIAIVDPWGLLSARDYLPCLQVFEVLPPMRPLPAGSAPRHARRRQRGGTLDRAVRSGTELRELRDFQPGDPPRMIAWKATVRQQRLITRNFDDEHAAVECVALDISSSMRAGSPRGKKFDHALRVAAGLCATALDQRCQVGLWSFDYDLFGEIEPGRGNKQRRRLRRHLGEVKSPVDPRRTALDDREVREALADYLLVQERLDFRRRRGLEGNADAELLERWLDSQLEAEQLRRANTPGGVGVVQRCSDPARRFFRLRGIPLAAPSEMEPGSKVSGLQAVARRLLRHRIGGARLTVITDLCGLNDVEALRRPLRALRSREIELRFLVPFTPDYGRRVYPEDSTDDLVRDLFARAERTDRVGVAEQIAALGPSVRFIGPEFAGLPER